MNTLTDRQWEVLAPLLPGQDFTKGGRPRADDRRTLEGILWVLRTGAQWKQMPREYGAYVTVWRRLRKWQEDGTWLRIWQVLLKLLDKKKTLGWDIHYLDGSFASAKKGGSV